MIYPLEGHGIEILFCVLFLCDLHDFGEQKSGLRMECLVFCHVREMKETEGLGNMKTTLCLKTDERGDLFARHA